MKEIVIGGQSFRDIILHNQLYLDKTKQLLKLINSGNKYYFLSRPRRFGKSLAIDTMKEMFLGNKKLFKGLYAYDHYKDWDASYPVILISMIGFSPEYDNDNIEGFLKSKTILFLGEERILLNQYYKKEFNNLGDLIEDVYAKTGKKVVVLVDEYDTPFTQNFSSTENFEKIKKFFYKFYGSVKDKVAITRFFYFGGLAKVGQTSLFSTLNNLYNISYDSDYYDIVGYTEKEIFHYFKDHIPEVLKNTNVNEGELKNILNSKYGGYCFGNQETIFNPWSINHFFKQKEFENYWAETGGQSLLSVIFEKYEDTFLSLFQEIEAEGKTWNDTLGSIEVINDGIIKEVMLNAGYLTFDSSKKRYLVFPNIEIKASIIKQYHNFISNTREEKKKMIVNFSKLLYNGIINGDDKIIKNALDNLFNINNYPYERIAKKPEGIMKSKIIDYLNLIDVLAFNESQTLNGRMDLVIVKDFNKMYIIEGKVNGSLEEGMKQINEKYSKHYHGYDGYKIVINWNINKKEFNVKTEKH